MSDKNRHRRTNQDRVIVIRGSTASFPIDWKPGFVLSLIIAALDYVARDRGKIGGGIEGERMSDRRGAAAGYSSVRNFLESFFMGSWFGGRFAISC